MATIIDARYSKQRRAKNSEEYVSYSFLDANTEHREQQFLAIDEGFFTP